MTSDSEQLPANQVQRPPLLTAAATAGPALEFASGWPAVLGALLGIGVGIFALPTPAIGVFMRGLQSEFGWTRAQISAGPTTLITVLALVVPLLGWLTDRIAAAWICGTGLALLGASLYCFSRLGPDVHVFYMGCAAMALVSCGSSTLPYARELSAQFVRARGLALGIAMVGNGISGVFLPILLVPYAAQAGWRRGFVALAAVAALAAPAVALLMSRGRAAAVVYTPATGRKGVAIKAAMRERTLWMLLLCFMCISSAVSGLQVHALSFLTDSGMPPTRAAAIMSFGGAGLIVGRLLTGWLIDRVFAPHVAAVVMTLSALCFAVTGWLGAPAAVLGVFAMGLSTGSEIDLIGYMTARYFGMHAYGRLYGLLYAAALLCTALSPTLYGLVFDATRSYTPALYGAAVLLFMSALLFLALPRFNPAVEAHQETL